MDAAVRWVEARTDGAVLAAWRAAILSTLALRDPVAIELPFERRCACCGGTCRRRPCCPPSRPNRPPYALPERQVDYLLFRLPPGWQAGYRVADER